uniref:Uncharacterized protein n=1 Tax=Anguilla anguilla TaxID=7936 RepID=A0A0E9S1Q9_ANGAN
MRVSLVNTALNHCLCLISGNYFMNFIYYRGDANGLIV